MKLENTPLHHSFYIFHLLEVCLDTYLLIEKINIQIDVICVINVTPTEVELLYYIQFAQYAWHLSHGPC